jgi:hypothetical protein
LFAFASVFSTNGVGAVDAGVHGAQPELMISLMKGNPSAV